MKTKIILVALGAMLLTVGCSGNASSTSETQSTSVVPSTSSITPKTRSEKVKDAASHLSEVFCASTESIVSEDTTFVVTLSNISFSIPSVFEVNELGGIVSFCSYKVNLEDEVKGAFGVILTSGNLKIGETTTALGGFGFNAYFLNSSVYLDISNQFVMALLVGVVNSYLPDLTPEQVLILIENVIGPSHKAQMAPFLLPLMSAIDSYFKDQKQQIDEWYQGFDFSIFNSDEYSFIDTGCSFVERQSGALECTASITKAGFYSLAIAGATSDEELIEITEDFEQIEKVNLSIGAKTDANKRLTYVSTYLDISVKGENAFKFEGSAAFEIKYDVVGISLPKSFAEYKKIELSGYNLGA